MLMELLKFGVVAWAVLGLGLAGLFSGVAALAMARSRSGPTVAIIALVLVVVAQSIGFATVTLERARTENAAREMTGQERAAFRSAGYEALRPLSFTSLGLGLPAAAAAIGALVVGLRRTHRAEKEEGKDPSWPVGRAALGAVALFSCAVSAMPLLMSAPKTTPNSEAQAAVGAAERHFADGRAREGCEALQVAFAAEAAVPKDPSGKLDSLVSHCVRSRLELAAQASSPQEREQALAWLEASKLPLTDGQRQEIDALRRAASEAPPTP